jgi:uncharacterized membrane protein YbhN (UPF0104 family)
VDRGAVAGTLVLEAVIDAACFLALFIITAPLIGGSRLLTTGIWVMAAAVALALVLLVLLARRRPAEAGSAAGRGLLARVWQVMESVRVGFNAVRSPWAVATASALTFADWLLASLGYAFVGRAFGLDEAPVVYLLVEVVSNLAGAVPFTQSGIGPYEIAVAQVLTRQGVSVEQAGAYAVGAHALVLLTTLVSGSVALLLLRLRLSEVFYLHTASQGERLKAEG